MQQKLILTFHIPSYVEIDTANRMREDMNEYVLTHFSVDDLPLMFYMPTDGEARVECINPVVLNEEQFKQYDQIITDIKNSEQYKSLKGEQTDN